MNFLTKLEEILKEDENRVNLIELQSKLEEEIKTIDKSLLPKNIVDILEDIPKFLELLWLRIHKNKNLTQVLEKSSKPYFIDNKLIA